MTDARTKVEPVGWQLQWSDGSFSHHLYSEEQAEGFVNAWRGKDCPAVVGKRPIYAAPQPAADALDDVAKEAALNIGWRWFGVGHHDAAAVASEIEQLIADDRAKRDPSTSTEGARAASDVPHDVVRALEWRDGEARSTLGDLYTVASLGGSVFQVRLNGTAFTGWHSSADEAKDAAQAHFDRARAAPQPAAADVAGYVHTVPDHCDRIVWRGTYHHLPLATPAPSTSTVAEVYGWHRSKAGFEIDFMRGPDRPRNATSAPDEWVPLYTAAPSSTEEALRAENALLTKALARAIQTLDDISDSPGPFADDAAWTRVKAAEEALPSLRDTLSALSR